MAAIAAGVANPTDLRAAITASDNSAAERLWSSLGGSARAAAATTAQLRKHGDGRTTVPARRLRPAYTAFGQTDWGLAAQTRFTARIRCSAAGRQVLKLMGDVIPAQRWGLGATDHRAQFKAGWGPGVRPGAADGWTDRQTGLVAIGGRLLAVSLLTDAPDHASGIRSVTALARWAVDHVSESQLPAASCSVRRATAAVDPPAASSAILASAPGEALAGKVVVLDPGHNGANAANPAAINRLVDAGGFSKPCNTTGTATNGGYSEAAYNWDLANRVRRLLLAAGARVVLTRKDNTSIGPCVNRRAAIGNRAGADAVVSLHADGATPSARGFHVIHPSSIPRYTADIAADSRQLAVALRDAYRATGMPDSTYLGTRGLDVRGDLGGLNLSDVPVVFLEGGNMRNARDAALLMSPAFRQRAARAVVAGIAQFLAS